ncbi:MAG: OB-fold domain-containing protein [Dehalococcoidia bacterium]|nr:MAG: thiolase [bacterium]MCE7929424.1 thiolase [Chloroflexi bacterium CFX7]MCK6565240.1 OB-fold domain-containing protein [Dehalococcoidia bacterium]MCL4231239.1 OB-fold domain-containing protein [Dehalococcoidia bacterium]NUQ56068.1 OB-fold domain-containing protein [Dehalococcoidia bacterium]
MAFFGPEMPLPAIGPDTRDFWEACREHRLVVQRCTGCQSFRFAPAPVCFECHSWDYENVESNGVGEVYTWTITHRAIHPAVAQAVPYNTVVVRLLDCGGAMITSNLVGVANEEIRPGMLVRVEWDEIDSDITLPRFRPL